ncbi:MAG: hypothetical protein ABFS21_08515 [Actinomycetota bacterium]
MSEPRAQRVHRETRTSPRTSLNRPNGSYTECRAFPTEDEARAILPACPETTYGIHHRALFTLFYRTGLRFGEALALWPSLKAA